MRRPPSACARRERSNRLAPCARGAAAPFGGRCRKGGRAQPPSEARGAPRTGGARTPTAIRTPGLQAAATTAHRPAPLPGAAGGRGHAQTAAEPGTRERPRRRPLSRSERWAPPLPRRGFSGASRTEAATRARDGDAVQDGREADGAFQRQAPPFEGAPFLEREFKRRESGLDFRRGGGGRKGCFHARFSGHRVRPLGPGLMQRFEPSTARP